MANYLIVGATSGIGAEIARRLMEDGAHVVSISRSAESEANEHYSADVTRDALPPISLPIQGIVYCPGSITLKPFAGLKQDDFLADFNVNALGAARVLQQYLPNLKMCENASVVLFSTVAVTVGMAYHASIAMAKGAVEGLTRSLAAEWAPRIRVNCIAPSLTDTRLAGRLLDSDQKRAGAAERHPLKTIGRAGDVAAIAHMLLSSNSSFVTGQIWHVDGGISAVKS